MQNANAEINEFYFYFHILIAKFLFFIVLDRKYFKCSCIIQSRTFDPNWLSTLTLAYLDSALICLCQHSCFGDNCPVFVFALCRSNNYCLRM